MMADARQRRRTVLLDGDPRAPQQARLGAALAARGHRVIVLDAPEIVRQIEVEFGQSCQALARPASSLGPASWPLLVAAARWLGVDVVHLNYLEPAQRPWTLPGAPPYVATVWGSDLNARDFPRTQKFIAQIDRVLGGAAAITADSAPLLSMARSRAGELRSRPSELVFWGVDTEGFCRARHHDASAAMRNDLGIEPTELVLLGPRQIAPHYHADRIVRAFASSAWPGQGVLVLKLHGKDGEDANVVELQGLADGLGVGPRIRFAPRCAYDFLPSVYAMADVGISALEADGVPSTFLELMALEVPVVATALPSYRGVLEEDRAMLVPVGDVAAMAHALDRLCQESELRATLAARAREWVVKHADWSQCVDRWEALYEHAIGAA